MKKRRNIVKTIRIILIGGGYQVDIDDKLAVSSTVVKNMAKAADWIHGELTYRKGIKQRLKEALFG